MERDSPLSNTTISRTAIKFFSSCVIWYDCLSCISLRQPTRLTPHYERLLLGPTPELGHDIDLSPISGCQNWITVLIGQLATLTATHDSASGSQLESQLEFKILDLEKSLDTQIATARNALDAFRQSYAGCPSHWRKEDYNKHTVLVVTYVFATAARIQLEGIKTPNMIEVDTKLMTEAIEALRMVPEPAM